MKKSVVSITGLDSSGIIYTITNELLLLHCDIDVLTQTILKNQFTAIFIITKPYILEDSIIHTVICESLSKMNSNLYISVHPFIDNSYTPVDKNINYIEPFIVTVEGKSTIELIVIISKIFAQKKINIQNLTTAYIEKSPPTSLIVCEISIPSFIKKELLRNELKQQAKLHQIHITIQHRDIFETIHHVPLT